MTLCPICGLSVLYHSGNRLVCPKCRHMEAVKKGAEKQWFTILKHSLNILSM